MTWNDLIPHIEQAIAEIQAMMQQSAYAPYGVLLQQRMAVMMYRLSEAKRLAREESNIEAAH